MHGRRAQVAGQRHLGGRLREGGLRVARLVVLEGGLMRGADEGQLEVEVELGAGVLGAVNNSNNKKKKMGDNL